MSDFEKGAEAMRTLAARVPEAAGYLGFAREIRALPLPAPAQQGESREASALQALCAEWDQRAEALFDEQPHTSQDLHAMRQGTPRSACARHPMSQVDLEALDFEALLIDLRHGLLRQSGLSEGDLKLEPELLPMLKQASLIARLSKAIDALPALLAEVRAGREARPLVYLACPYTHDDRAVRVARFDAANVAASRLMRDDGLKVFSPISHTHPIAEAGGLPLGWEFWEAFDRAYIGHSCKVIVLRVDGWRESKGVQAEIRIAAEYGIPVEYIDPAALASPSVPTQERGPMHVGLDGSITYEWGPTPESLHEPAPQEKVQEAVADATTPPFRLAEIQAREKAGLCPWVFAAVGKPYVPCRLALGHEEDEHDYTPAPPVLGAAPLIDACPECGGKDDHVHDAAPEKAALKEGGGRKPEIGRCICGDMKADHTRPDATYPEWKGCTACARCLFFRQEDEISIGMADGSLIATREEVVPPVREAVAEVARSGMAATPGAVSQQPGTAPDAPGHLAEGPPSAAAAPAPGDAVALLALLADCQNVSIGHWDCKPEVHINTYAARVRSEEKDRLANLGWASPEARAHEVAIARGQEKERCAKIADSQSPLHENDTADNIAALIRASDATVPA